MLVRVLVTAQVPLPMQVRFIHVMPPTDQPLPALPARLLALAALIHSHFRNPDGGMPQSSADAAQPQPPTAVQRTMRTPAERSAPERFDQSDYARWSPYQMGRQDQRHLATVREAVDEAHASEPALSAELSELFSRLRRGASDATGSDPASSSERWSAPLPPRCMRRSWSA